MNIAAILHQRAKDYPQVPAIIDTAWGRDRTTPFAALDLAASRGATLLRQSGLKPGDGVLVFHPMSAELYIVLAALWRVGLVAIVLDPSAGRAHLEQACALAAPQALIASAKAHLLRLVSPGLRQIPHPFAIALPVPGAIPWSRSHTLPADPDIFPATAETPALLTFTSGSTGSPKAAMRTHGFLLSQYEALQASLHLQPGATDLATLPIFVLANLAAGMTSLIPRGDLRFPGAIAPGPILQQINRHRPSRIVASPAFLERLAHSCHSRHQTLPTVKQIFSGGAPIMPHLLPQIRALAPNATLEIVYGSTEAEPIAQIAQSQIHPEDQTAMVSGQGLLVGKPVACIQLQILRHQWGHPLPPYTSAEFEQDCLPPHTVGEIVVSGHHVLPRYWQGIGDRQIKFQVEGQVWHRTGDAGYLDTQGRLWLMGRCQARIVDQAGTLYPFAVEAAAHAIPGIHRAAVVSHQGQRLLVVELQNAAAKAQLPTLAASLSWANLQRIKVIKRIPVDPRHNAKVDYPRLLHLLESRIAT